MSTSSFCIFKLAVTITMNYMHNLEYCRIYVYKKSSL